MDPWTPDTCVPRASTVRTFLFHITKRKRSDLSHNACACFMYQYLQLTALKLENFLPFNFLFAAMATGRWHYQEQQQQVSVRFSARRSLVNMY